MEGSFESVANVSAPVGLNPNLDSGTFTGTVDFDTGVATLVFTSGRATKVYTGAFVF